MLVGKNNSKNEFKTIMNAFSHKLEREVLKNKHTNSNFIADFCHVACRIFKECQLKTERHFSSNRESLFIVHLHISE